MRTKILGVMGAALLVSSTVQMAAANEHHVRRDRAPVSEQEQFRDSNAYDAAPDNFYAAPESFAVRPYRWLSDQDEGAMSSGIAGH